MRRYRNTCNPFRNHHPFLLAVVLIGLCGSSVLEDFIVSCSSPSWGSNNGYSDVVSNTRGVVHVAQAAVFTEAFPFRSVVVRTTTATGGGLQLRMMGPNHLSTTKGCPRRRTNYDPLLIRRGGGEQQQQNREHATLESKTRLSATATASSELPNKKLKAKRKRSKKKLLVTLWIHVISIFVGGNYLFVKSDTCWPSFLQLWIPLKVWNLIHGFSAMIFAGSIFTTTVIEWNIFENLKKTRNATKGTTTESSSSSESVSAVKMIQNLFQIETFLVLPALTGSMVSGVVQAFYTYGSLRYAPKHVKLPLHILLTFGLWWGITDRRTQGKLLPPPPTNDEGNDTAAVMTSTITDNDTVWIQRRISNVVSCLFLVALYSVMILKPGFASYNK